MAGPLPEPDPRRLVRVLPDALSNQIAAGEVVERPASVVKELVENALDAGATRVVVEIGEGARDLTVTDDGCGMSREDAETAVRRFATSKIASLDDLHQIGTFGFRGEALPSIASVSRFVMETCLQGEATGTRLEIEGGRLVSVKEFACPKGTRIQVGDLFFNTPARLKFLKTAPYEIRMAIQGVARIALATTGTGFKVLDRGKVALQMSPDATLVERVGAVLGVEAARGMFGFEGSSNGLRATGLAGAPELARSNARDLLVYVNGRSVKERTATAACIEAYRSLLPHGRYPLAVILLDVPLEMVDVNVHPAKTEVRFARTDDVWRSVHRGIENALREAPWARGSAGRVPSASPVQGTLPAGAVPQPGLPGTALYPHASPAGEPSRVYRLVSGNVAAPMTGPQTQPLASAIGDDDDPRTFFRSVRVYGQYQATYLLGERNGELVLIDQHAAHERVMFEKLRAAASSNAIPVQRLLVPQVVELPAADARAAADLLPLLAKTGLEAEPFGERAVVVRAVPAALARLDPGKLLKDALDEIAGQGRSGTMSDRVDDVLARMACHSAVRAGDVLSSEEVSKLLADMDGIDFAANCPHGRPVVVRFPVEEVEKWFERR